MTNDLAALRAECERLHAEMTAGAWALMPDKHDSWGMVRDGNGMPVVSTYFAAQIEGGFDGEDEFRRTHKFGTPEYWRGPEQCALNGEGIAALRNALPAIIAALARVEALEAALREAKVWMVGDAPADVQQHIDGLLAAKPNTPATGGEPS